MSNTFHQVYLQSVFAVKYRRAVIKPEWKDQLQAVIGNLINQHGGKTFIVNGVEDHMHCFFGLAPPVSISDLMHAVKAKSSKYINEHRLTPARFEWQRGFGVFSYYKNDKDRIYKYVQNQEVHHKTVNLHDEYIALLQEFEIDFDPKYIFQPLV
jgi:putative transposase